MLSKWTQWQTTKALAGTGGITFPPDPLDIERLNAYALYEQIYWTVPDAFKLTQRGTDAQPIYLPNGRTIVEATNRFLAVNADWQVQSTGAQSELIKTLLRALFAREKVYAKLAMQKRYGLIRGDAIWHVIADPSKPPGSRVSLYAVDPAAYFPIEDPDVPTRVIGCHLVTIFEDPNTKRQSIRRRTYRKTDRGTITTGLALYEMSAWDDRLSSDPTPKLMAQLQKVTELPPAITALPVYHVPNITEPEALFGSSEMRGLESIMASVNQSISDEDYALAMQGLGMYWTNSGPPLDENDNETNWKLGPGRVVEIEQDATFGRVSGVGDVSPIQQHVQFVLNQAYEATSVPDIARGAVDVTVAESGIALYLQLAPLLAKNAERENEMLPTLDHLIYDLVHGWYPAYEQVGDMTGVQAGITVGDPMPHNRDAKIAEIIALATSVPPLISAEYARTKLAELGYNDLPVNMQQTIVQEQNALADPFLNRLAKELGDEPPVQ